MPADDHALNLVGSLEDLHDLHLAQRNGERPFRQVRCRRQPCNGSLGLQGSARRARRAATVATGLDAKARPQTARWDGSIKPLTRNAAQVHRDGTPVYRVRFVDPVGGKQRERQVAGYAAAQTLLARYVVHKATRLTTRFVAVRASFDELAQPFLADYRFKLNGEWRPYSTWHNAYTNLYCYVLPTLGPTRIGDVSTLGLVEFVRGLTRADGQPARARQPAERRDDSQCLL